MFNGLDYPGVTLPVTSVNPTLDARAPAHDFSNDEDRKLWEECKLSTPNDPVHILNLLLVDSAELLAGAPVGLQVIGRRFEDETVVAAAEAVDDALKVYKSLRASHL